MTIYDRITQGYYSKKDLESDRFFIIGQDLTSLYGIHMFKNLKRLSISDTSINSLKELDYLNIHSGIKKIHCTNNRLLTALYPIQYWETLEFVLLVNNGFRCEKEFETFRQLNSRAKFFHHSNICDTKTSLSVISFDSNVHIDLHDESFLKLEFELLMKQNEIFMYITCPDNVNNVKLLTFIRNKLSELKAIQYLSYDFLMELEGEITNRRLLLKFSSDAYLISAIYDIMNKHCYPKYGYESFNDVWRFIIPLQHTTYYKYEDVTKIGCIVIFLQNFFKQIEILINQHSYNSRSPLNMFQYDTYISTSKKRFDLS